MFFKGLPAAKDRADVIAYLETLKKGTGLILLRHNNRTGAIHGLAGLCRWL